MMGASNFVAILLFISCVHEIFADDPVFPSFAGDLKLSGYYLIGKYPEDTFTYWWSDDKKSHRQDYTTYGGTKTTTLWFGTKSEWGTEVLLAESEEGGCSYKEGIELAPIEYKGFLDDGLERELVDTMYVDGIEFNVWEAHPEGMMQRVYIKETENGGVPIRFIEGETTWLIHEYSNDPIEDDIFAYDEESCTQKGGNWDINGAPQKVNATRMKF